MEHFGLQFSAQLLLGSTWPTVYKIYRRHFVFLTRLLGLCSNAFILCWLSCYRPQKNSTEPITPATASSIRGSGWHSSVTFCSTAELLLAYLPLFQEGENAHYAFGNHLFFWKSADSLCNGSGVFSAYASIVYHHTENFWSRTCTCMVALPGLCVSRYGLFKV